MNHTSRQPGPRNGLVLSLFVNQADYLYAVSSSAGFRVWSCLLAFLFTFGGCFLNYAFGIIYPAICLVSNMSSLEICNTKEKEFPALFLLNNKSFFLAKELFFGHKCP